MSTYNIIITLAKVPTEEQMDAFDARDLGDATFGREGGRPIIEFDREAVDVRHAVASILTQLALCHIKTVAVVTEGWTE